jgi:hypothetical protein
LKYRSYVTDKFAVKSNSMKNIYNSLFLILVSLASFAQTAFFQSTSYRGAFAPAPEEMWTAGWCNWDPQNAVYAAPTVTVSANITENTTWTASNTYLLQGQIYVKNNATLTIEAGTVIHGDINTDGSGLFITKGSKLIAIGTASQPIVFTSSQPVGSRSLGDWGGIILLGKAANNNPGGIGNIEGIAPSADTEFGGGTSPDDNDNSGTLQYVRIEFGGYVYAQNKEINGLTFGSVGRGTTIDHIQVSFANDDAFEWFGGTVNCKNLVAYRCLDDDWDTDNGYRGNVQFCLGVKDPEIADNPSVSTSEGFESDNNSAGDATTPLTAAIFSNVTDIGPLRGDISTAGSVEVGFRRAARIRRNSNLKIVNSVLIDHLRGVHIDGTLCEENATSGSIVFKNNIIAGNQAGKVCEVNTGSTFEINDWFGQNSNDSLVSTDGILTTPYNYLAPDYRPASASMALTGADFSDAIFNGLILSMNTIASELSPVILFPNPASSFTTLSFHSKSANTVSMDVVDLSGRSMLKNSANQQLTEGMNTLKLNTETLNPGFYFIILNNDKTQQSFKFIICK